MIEQLQHRLAHVESLLGVAYDNSPPTRPVAAGCGDGSPRRVSLANPIPSRHNDPSLLFPAAASFLHAFRSTDELNPRLTSLRRNLRSLHESLKLHHKRRTLSSFNCDMQQMLSIVPHQRICISLAELYFDNMEHCFRILHRQTFYSALRAFFDNPNAPSTTDFLPVSCSFSSKLRSR